MDDDRFAIFTWWKLVSRWMEAALYICVNNDQKSYIKPRTMKDIISSKRTSKWYHQYFDYRGWFFMYFTSILSSNPRPNYIQVSTFLFLFALNFEDQLMSLSAYLFTILRLRLNDLKQLISICLLNSLFILSLCFTVLVQLIYAYTLFRSLFSPQLWTISSVTPHMLVCSPDHSFSIFWFDLSNQHVAAYLLLLSRHL